MLLQVGLVLVIEPHTYCSISYRLAGAASASLSYYFSGILGMLAYAYVLQRSPIWKPQWTVSSFPVLKRAAWLSQQMMQANPVK